MGSTVDRGSGVGKLNTAEDMCLREAGRWRLEEYRTTTVQHRRDGF
jgi:hypothetical protein